MQTRPNAEISAAERAEIFHETFDDQIDAGDTLADLLLAAGGYLERIVGEAPAAAAMRAACAQIIETGGEAWREDWREALNQARSSVFSETPLGQRFHDLAAYAHFGISLAPSDVEDEDWLRERVEEAAAFVAVSPLELWLGPDRTGVLEELALLSSARWALDNGRPVEPAALAIFGGVSAGRMRNMTTGSKRDFTVENGRVPALEALAWLTGRESFWPSIWREQAVPFLHGRDTALAAPRFVPEARDGTVFHPGLLRNGGYMVGPKGAETKLAAFDEALAALQSMPEPFWRRPNEAGSWGIVRGVEWRRLDQSDLDGIAGLGGP